MPQKIGKKIRELRAKNEMTQQELADLVGCAVTTVSGWENRDTRSPGKRLLLKVANALGVSVEYLINDQEITERKDHKCLLPMYGQWETDGFNWENAPPEEFIEVTEREYSPDRFMLKVKDSKMSPFILAGDYCVFERKMPKNQDIVIVTMSGQKNKSVIKRWKEFENFVLLESTNPYIDSASYSFILAKAHLKEFAYSVKGGIPKKIVVKGVLQGVKRNL